MKPQARGYAMWYAMFGVLAMLLALLSAVAVFRGGKIPGEDE